MLKSRVLVLDDDEDNRSILEAVLSREGFQVTTAASSAEAQAMLAESPVDALVTDLSLGDGTAFELMDALGAKRPKVAVLVTGFDSSEDRARAKAVGFDAHLVKPIDLAALRNALTSALGAPE